MIPQISVDEYGHVTSASDKSVTITMPTLPTLSDLSGVSSISASGTAPLNLNASKSGTTVTLTGSVDVMTGATSSANGKSGLVPTPAKGNQNSFLKGDGSWGTPTNTTYTFAGGTNKFTVTPSGGTAQEVTVTPSISNNVTYNGTWTAGQIATLDSTSGKIKASGYTIATSVPANALFTDTIYSAGTGLKLDGTTFNHSNSVTAKTNYCSTATTASANGGKIIVTDVKYDAQGHITATTDRTITLSQDHTRTNITAGTAGTSTATGGASIDIPYVTVNAYGHVTAYGTHKHSISGFLTSETYKGTVTSVAAGTGLTGGTITDSGTIKAKLKSETPLTVDATIRTEDTTKVYPVGVDKAGYLAVNVPWTTYSNATTTAAGLMSAGDKTKLEGIETGA